MSLVRRIFFYIFVRVETFVKIIKFDHETFKVIDDLASCFLLCLLNLSGLHDA